MTEAAQPQEAIAPEATAKAAKPATQRSRFSYVKYDADITRQQEGFKAKFEELEDFINTLEDGRPKSVALTKIEEAYMWVGKSLRDTQIKKDGEVRHIEERSNG